MAGHFTYENHYTPNASKYKKELHLINDHKSKKKNFYYVNHTDVKWIRNKERNNKQESFLWSALRQRIIYIKSILEMTQIRK